MGHAGASVTSIKPENTAKREVQEVSLQELPSGIAGTHVRQAELVLVDVYSSTFHLREINNLVHNGHNIQNKYDD